MNNIKCVGVPEHFNLPWKIAQERGLFNEQGINFTWEDVPQGTGAMCQLLKDKKTDLAVMLTEGSVLDILKGNPSRIVSSFIQTPLYWGVHSLDEAFSVDSNTEFLISRYNSGSHLMAYSLAQKNKVKLKKDNFIVVDHLQGAITYYKNFKEKGKKSPLFLWEKYTTMSFLDQNHLFRVSELPTPWPAFLIIGRESFLFANKELVNTVISIIEKVVQELVKSATFLNQVSVYSNLNLEQTKEWIGQTKWGFNKPSLTQLQLVVNYLDEWELVKNPVKSIEELLY